MIGTTYMKYKEGSMTTKDFIQFLKDFIEYYEESHFKDYIIKSERALELLNILITDNDEYFDYFTDISITQQFEQIRSRAIRLLYDKFPNRCVEVIKSFLLGIVDKKNFIWYLPSEIDFIIEDELINVFFKSWDIITKNNKFFQYYPVVKGIGFDDQLGWRNIQFLIINKNHDILDEKLIWKRRISLDYRNSLKKEQFGNSSYFYLDEIFKYGETAKMRYTQLYLARKIFNNYGLKDKDIFLDISEDIGMFRMNGLNMDFNIYFPYKRENQLITNIMDKNI